MTISFRAVGTRVNATTTGDGNYAASLTPGIPAGTAAGDLLIASVVLNTTILRSGLGGGVISPGPDGFGKWHKANVLIQAGGSTKVQQEIFVKIAESGETAPTFVMADGSSRLVAAVIIGYSNTGTMRYEDLLVSSDNSATSAGSYHTIWELQPVPSDYKAMYVAVGDANTAFSTPSSFTERYDAGDATTGTRHAFGDSNSSTGGGTYTGPTNGTSAIFYVRTTEFSSVGKTITDSYVVAAAVTASMFPPFPRHERGLIQR